MLLATLTLPALKNTNRTKQLEWPLIDFVEKPTFIRFLFLSDRVLHKSQVVQNDIFRDPYDYIQEVA
jgi:hypothetical protein